MSKWGISVRRLLADERGAVVVWTTVGMFGFFAMGALLLDGGRMFNLNTQMQSYADHVALAAAAELDGDSNAIERAIRAASGDKSGPEGASVGPIVTDTQNYAFVADKSLTVKRLTFLSKLGSGQNRAGEFVAGDVVEYTHTVGGALPDAATLAPLSRRSRFVQVVVEPRDVTFVMAPVLAALGVGSASALDKSAVSAGAIAGFTRAACKFPPLMMCNPTEKPEPPYGGPFDWESMMGKMVLMKAKDPGNANDAWGPGDFGLLRLDELASTTCSGGGKDLVRCVLGQVDPGTQCVLQGADVDMEPGSGTGPVEQGLNIRFDIWSAESKQHIGDASYAPARNVIKGKTTDDPKKCTINDLVVDGASVPLPRDPDVSDANRIGSGVSRETLVDYWTTNHGATWPFPAGLTPTRYDVYREEIARNPVTNGENMAPICAAPVTEPSPMDPVKDRRVLVIAVVNCKEQAIQGAQTNVSVENFALMFVTEPLGVYDTNTSNVYGEMIGLVKANQSNGVLHEFPVLYR